ncbi:MAG: FAD-dependent oxidoreductase [Coprothermobacterota bacterium]|nr:FAD-dependent oxidoreductase [Coprothermobacterota bacterium]
MPNSMPPRLKGAYWEAARCLRCCDPPCNQGCPAGIDVARFIRQLSKGDVSGAADTIERDNPFGLICGWICPSEVLCQKDCTARKLGRAIDIRSLQRFAIEENRRAGSSNRFLTRPQLAEQRIVVEGQVKREAPTNVAASSGLVAVIGSGPAGLTCGLILVRLGYRVELWEKTDTIGGRLSHGIPSFRLDSAVLRSELEILASPLIIHRSRAFGMELGLDDLRRQGCQAVFLATGKWRENIPEIPGNQLIGVSTADQILTQEDWKSAGVKSAAVVGAGNAAMDVARSLLAEGVEMVHVLYRRTPKELTSWDEEREEAWQAGVIFHLLCLPVALEGDSAGRVRSIVCARTAPGPLDSSGRRSFRAVEGYSFELPVEMVVYALGYGTDCASLESQGIWVDEEGFVRVNEDLATNVDGVFAGGDLIGKGRGTVVQAVADGKRAALSIHQYLSRERRQGE